MPSIGEEIQALQEELEALRIREALVERRILSIRRNQRIHEKGDLVSFEGTDKTAAGTGIVFGHTKGDPPFVRIARSDGGGEVKRKPHKLRLLLPSDALGQ